LIFLGDDMAIGDKILALRKQHGWSQQLLAKKVGTSGPIIGKDTNAAR
jgi:transcriptional regulator with XRE-family HTH domain